MTDHDASDASSSAASVVHDDEEFRAGIRRELKSIRRHHLPPVWDDRATFRGELGLDSLDLVELVARLEQATGIFVPDDDVARLTSIEATAEYVRARRLASPDSPSGAERQDGAAS